MEGAEETRGDSRADPGRWEGGAAVSGTETHRAGGVPGGDQEPGVGDGGQVLTGNNRDAGGSWRHPSGKSGKPGIEARKASPFIGDTES